LLIHLEASADYLKALIFINDVRHKVPFLAFFAYFAG
jgi:hypothetical protein